jgi:hypothetical protein
MLVTTVPNTNPNATMKALALIDDKPAWFPRESNYQVGVELNVMITGCVFVRRIDGSFDKMKVRAFHIREITEDYEAVEFNGPSNGKAIALKQDGTKLLINLGKVPVFRDSSVYIQNRRRGYILKGQDILIGVDDLDALEPYMAARLNRS